VSLGIHESQSRLYENLVARSRGFWSWVLPKFHEFFPAEQGKTLDQLWPALHGVTPSLVRVEADETTYNLHILIRFELERRLFSGGIAVEDLPAAWNQEYEDTLGVTPSSDADGVLQDIHWAMGAFGYFPTYTLGNLAASQLFDVAETDLGNLEEQFSQGSFSPIRDWLGDKIHSQGSRWTAADLLERATGEAPQSQAFLNHIRNKIDALKAL
ncbi:MAG: carboxypeptidase M32, partial [Planctomycetes bacterium]|nr:carboxypeptidase M32 [Planctomycetota bacterium]